MLDDPEEHTPAIEPESVAPAQPPTSASGTRPRPRRGRRRVAALVALVLGCVFTGLCLNVLYGCWWDDHSIESHRGQAVADVLSVSVNRTAVRFVTPDGTVYIPPNGVLYPVGLAAGEQVRVEYDVRNPNVVRVAGRDFQLAFLPVGSAIAGCWVLIGPVLWWLRRKPSRAAGHSAVA